MSILTKVWAFDSGTEGMQEVATQVFLPVNYSSVISASDDTIRGHRFRVSRKIKVTALYGGGTAGNFFVGLYAANGTVAYRRLASVHHVIGRQTRVPIAPLVLVPGQDYLLIQGVHDTETPVGSHNRINTINVSSMLASEPQIAEWEPDNGNIYCWASGYGDERVIDSLPGTVTSYALDIGFDWEDFSYVNKLIDHDISQDFRQCQGIVYGNPDNSNSVQILHFGGNWFGALHHSATSAYVSIEEHGGLVGGRYLRVMDDPAHTWKAGRTVTRPLLKPNKYYRISCYARSSATRGASIYAAYGTDSRIRWWLHWETTDLGADKGWVRRWGVWQTPADLSSANTAMYVYGHNRHNNTVSELDFDGFLIEEFDVEPVGEPPEFYDGFRIDGKTGDSIFTTKGELSLEVSLAKEDYHSMHFTTEDNTVYDQDAYDDKAYSQVEPLQHSIPLRLTTEGIYRLELMLKDAEGREFYTTQHLIYDYTSPEIGEVEFSVNPVDAGASTIIRVRITDY